MTRRRRDDVGFEEVAKRFLAGETIMELAEKFGTSDKTIKNRLDEARRKLPDLPWDSRIPRPVSDSVGRYVTMNDGKPGTRGMRPGSVIRGGRPR